MLRNEGQVDKNNQVEINLPKESVTQANAKILSIDAFIIGCGTVGGTLIDQIKEQQQTLLAKNNIDLTVYGIANHSNFMMKEKGVDLNQWTSLLKNCSQKYSLENLRKFIVSNKLNNPVIIDCTGNRGVALQYNDFLTNNIHIVTANKIANGEPLGYYQQIRNTAAQHNKRFQYETNIGAGLPVIEPLQKLLKSGDKLNRFEGILSGSLSYIFGELHKGLTLSQATLKAKELGYTEPDPREDLNGMDVARKVLIIAREIGMEIDISDIEVESVLPDEYTKLASADEFIQKLPELDDLFATRVEKAEKENKVLRYVATIIDGKCKVSIESIEESNPLYLVDDGENVLAFYSRYYQPKPLVIKGYGAGPIVTAAGVFSDLLRVID